MKNTLLLAGLLITSTAFSATFTNNGNGFIGLNSFSDVAGLTSLSYDGSYTDATYGTIAYTYTLTSTNAMTVSGGKLGISAGDLLTFGISFDTSGLNAGYSLDSGSGFRSINLQNIAAATDAGVLTLDGTATSFTSASDIPGNNGTITFSDFGANYSTVVIEGVSGDFDLAALNSSYSVSLDAVPEPSSATLLGLGGLALVVRRKR